jgi:hypothetical protein
VLDDHGEVWGGGRDGPEELAEPLREVEAASVGRVQREEDAARGHEADGARGAELKLANLTPPEREREREREREAAWRELNG